MTTARVFRSDRQSRILAKVGGTARPDRASLSPRHPPSLIGVVLVGHGEIAPAMVDAVRAILGSVDALVGVAVDSRAPIEQNRRQVADAIAAVDRGQGVLLLSDMFGGTPSNLCLSFLGPTPVAVISGFNLPMVVKLAGGLQTAPFAEVLATLPAYGRKNIVDASQVLEGTTDAGL